MDNTFIHEKLLPWLTFNPGLALTGFRTTRPWWISLSTFQTTQASQIFHEKHISPWNEVNEPYLGRSSCITKDMLLVIKKQVLFVQFLLWQCQDPPIYLPFHILQLVKSLPFNIPKA